MSSQAFIESLEIATAFARTATAFVFSAIGFSQIASYFNRALTALAGTIKSFNKKARLSVFKSEHLYQMDWFL
jgi:hypothetical protein